MPESDLSGIVNPVDGWSGVPLAVLLTLSPAFAYLLVRRVARRGREGDALRVALVVAVLGSLAIIFH